MISDAVDGETILYGTRVIAAVTRLQFLNDQLAAVLEMITGRGFPGVDPGRLFDPTFGQGLRVEHPVASCRVCTDRLTGEYHVRLPWLADTPAERADGSSRCKSRQYVSVIKLVGMQLFK